MKCTCGNEQGKPRVKPFPVRITGQKKDDFVDLYYMAGMRVLENGKFECWFCAVDVLTDEQRVEARELARSLS